jgi:peptidase E
MNRYLFASFLALAAAATMSAAYADDPTIDPHTFVSTRSMADVQQELRQYKASGVNPWATSYNQLTGFHSVRTRADVTAEYLAARDEVSALGGEDSGSAYLMAHARHSVAPTNFAAQ